MNSRKQKSYWILAGVATFLAAGLMLYAQTDAFAWDEGFHLLTAQLISRGKRPYVDFIFPQTPLNAYWNAFWLTVFPWKWRTAHAVSALMTAGAVFLITDYLFVRFPVPRWRFPMAFLGTVMVGLNILAVEYGTIGQAYGLALFLIVAAFRLTVVSVDRKGVALAGLAGLLSAAAAGSTLLSAPVCPVLALWTVVQNRAGSRWAKLASFLLSAFVAFLPILNLFRQGPKQTIFDVLQYHLQFRQVAWSGALAHDFIDVLLAWSSSAQALSLGLLALAGLLYVGFRSRPEENRWTKPQRSEFYLCGWLALAIGLHLSSAHPTFQRYFLLTVPFVAILATAGIYSVSNRLFAPDKPFWPVLGLTLIFALELTRVLHADRANFIGWKDLEEIAAKADQVTPPGAPILADEYLYFLTGRTPPPGMEHIDSHKLSFPPERAIPLHLISEAQEIQQMKDKRFATAVDCDKGQTLSEEDFKKVYRQNKAFDTCTVYWDLKP